MRSLGYAASGILIACGAGADPPFEREVLPSGRVVVSNTGVPAWTAQTAWRLEEDLRLGAIESVGPDAFTRIQAVLADSLGMIYVLDLPSQEIRTFHPDGTFSHTIGGRGRSGSRIRGSTVSTGERWRATRHWYSRSTPNPRP